MGKKKKGGQKSKKGKGNNKNKNNNKNDSKADDDGWDMLDDLTLQDSTPVEAAAAESKTSAASSQPAAAAAADDAAAAAMAFLNGGAAPPAPAANVAAPAEQTTDTAPAAEPVDNAANAALAFLGTAGGDAEGASNKKKKKKKKKKPNAKAAEKAKPQKESAIAARIRKQQEAKAREEAERKAFEDEQKRLQEEEEARIKAEEDAKRAKKEAKKARRAQMKKDGLIKTKAEKKREAAAKAAREAMIQAGMIDLSKSGSREDKKGPNKKKKPKVSKKARKEAEEQRLLREAEERARAKDAEEKKARKLAEKDSSSDGGGWEDDASDDDVKIDAAVLKEFSDEESDEELQEARRAQIDIARRKKAAEAKAKKKAEQGEKSDSDEWDASDSDDEGERKLDEAREAREARMKEAMETRSGDELRSPILCVLGHVDTGKTKLLDKIRQTNVQDGEAGGITQQIGATYFPMENIRRKTQELNRNFNLEYRVPGLLVIDTPGHESFTNLRSRGSGLCDIAILVIDIMHGLEPQTIESIQLLRSRKTPFIVALNKVDRLYGWKVQKNAPIRDSLANQKADVVQEFEMRTNEALVQLAEQGLNAKLYYENDDFRRNVSVVPTSAITGEGVPDILLLTVQITQDLMTSRLMYHRGFECSLLEVKVVEGHGTTIDVVLVNGEIHDSDTLVVCGMNGPIVTPIRALLTTPSMKELRIKSDYVKNKKIKAAMGVKISAQNLDGAVAGTNVLVYRKEDGDDLAELKRCVMEDFEKVMSAISTQDRGVYVQASTLGALEALLEFLASVEIPVCGVQIGPVHRKDVVKASVMLEHKPEWAVILAFDVKVDRDATAYAEKLGVKIFTADIIYHLQVSASFIMLL